MYSEYGPDPEDGYGDYGPEYGPEEDNTVMIVILSLAGIVLLVVGYFCLFSSTPDQDKIARGAIMIGDTPVKIPLIGKTDDDLCTPTAAGVALGVTATAGVLAAAYACYDPKGFRSIFGDKVGDATGTKKVDNTYLYASVGAGALALGGLGLYSFRDKIPEWLKFWKKFPKWLKFWEKFPKWLRFWKKSGTGGDDSDTGGAGSGTEGTGSGTGGTGAGTEGTGSGTEGTGSGTEGTGSGAGGGDSRTGVANPAGDADKIPQGMSEHIPEGEAFEKDLKGAIEDASNIYACGPIASWKGNDGLDAVIQILRSKGHKGLNANKVLVPMLKKRGLPADYEFKIT